MLLNEVFCLLLALYFFGLLRPVASEKMEVLPEGRLVAAILAEFVFGLFVQPL